MGKHNFSYYAVVLFAIVVAIIFMVYLKQKPSSKQKQIDTYIPQHHPQVENFVGGERIEDIVDDFQLIGIEPDQNIPEMAVSFGTGPGIYGSNRNFSEGIFIKDPNLYPYN